MHADPNTVRSRARNDFTVQDKYVSGLAISMEAHGSHGLTGFVNAHDILTSPDQEMIRSERYRDGAKPVICLKVLLNALSDV